MKIGDLKGMKLFRLCENFIELCDKFHKAVEQQDVKKLEFYLEEQKSIEEKMRNLLNKKEEV